MRKDSKLEIHVGYVLQQFREDPFHKDLRTHKVNTSRFGKVYSSRVTGDLRILWEFREKSAVILAIAFGGHSGGKKVYN